MGLRTKCGWDGWLTAAGAAVGDSVDVENPVDKAVSMATTKENGAFFIGLNCFYTG